MRLQPGHWTPGWRAVLTSVLHWRAGHCCSCVRIVGRWVGGVAGEEFLYCCVRARAHAPAFEHLWAVSVRWSRQKVLLLVVLLAKESSDCSQGRWDLGFLALTLCNSRTGREGSRVGGRMPSGSERLLLRRRLQTLLKKSRYRCRLVGLKMVNLPSRMSWEEDSGKFIFG